MPEMLYEFVGMLTKLPTEGEVNKCMLSMRYHHRNELPSFVDFSVLILTCRNLSSQKEILYGTVEKVYKRLLLEADFFFVLITYAKLLPLLAWAENRSQRQVDTCFGPAFRQLTKPISGAKSKAIMNQEASKILSQHLMLLRFLDSKNFFLFYFQLINGTQDQEHNIDFYFLELQTQIAQQTLLSSSEIAVIQRNVYSEYSKLRKRKYKEELIRAVYRWFEQEVSVFKEEADTSANRLVFQILTQAIRSQNNICGATLLQVLDSSLQSFHPAKIHYFLEFVDVCIVEGTYKIATQTILFLLCTFFHKIQVKKVKVSCLLVLQHFQLWKQVAVKRRLPFKLIECLAEWLPFLYGSERAVLKGEPELLQLYRKELIKLEHQSDISQISGLKLVIEELEFRKIDAIYAQLQKFHEEIAHPQLSKPPQQPDNKLNFNYKPSGLSRNNSQINSLLNSLLSKATQSPDKSRHQQLQLLSKPHSLSGNGSLGSQRSFGEQVEIILSLIDLFDYRVKSISQVTSQVSKESQYEPYSFDSQRNKGGSNVLPILSTLGKLPSHSSWNNYNSKLQRRQVSINCPSLSEQTKKKMAKHRGLITKTKSIEIGYLFEAKQSKLSFFVTLLHHTAKFSLVLRGNSFKFKSSRAEIVQPKPNKQYKLSFQLQAIKLYSLQGVQNSQRLVRSKMEIRLGDNLDNEVYDIPISVFNFIEWLDLLPEEEVLFDRPPILQTKWLPACPQFAKHVQDYLKRFCTFHRDKQGGFHLKSRFLGKKTLVKILQVLGELKLQLLSECEWILWGLCQVLL